VKGQAVRFVRGHGGAFQAGNSVCLRHGAARKGKQTVEYRSYQMAKDRCTNPKNNRWKYYGGRGIRFLFTSFEQFFAELGLRPPRMTVDRINNDGHYELGNVRWATRKEQRNNRCQRAHD